MSADIEELLAIIRAAGLLEDHPSLIRHRPLAEQGIDSLTFFHIFLLIEERYGIKVADEEMPALATLDDIASLLRARQAMGGTGGPTWPARA